MFGLNFFVGFAAASTLAPNAAFADLRAGTASDAVKANWLSSGFAVPAVAGASWTIRFDRGTPRSQADANAKLSGMG